MALRVYPNADERARKDQQADEKHNHRWMMYNICPQICDRMPLSHSVLVTPYTKPESCSNDFTQLRLYPKRIRGSEPA